MELGDTVKINSLKWVKQDLKLLLDDMQKHFEIYLDSDQSEPLHEVMVLAKQAAGILTMVQLSPGLTLCNELLVALQQLSEGLLKRNDEVDESLLRAIIQLGDYLDIIVSTGRDQIAIVLPVLNDLRTLRGVALYTDSVESVPSVENFTPTAANNTVAHGDIQKLAKKIRIQFQIGLLAWLKGTDVEGGIRKMQSVVEQLRHTATHDASSRLWWGADGLLQCIGQNGLDITATIKSLIGKLDRQIKLLASVGEAEFSRQIPNDLVKNILYYISHSHAKGEIIEDVKQQFKQAASDDLILHAPNDELLQTVAAAIKEDINQAKDILDIHGAIGDVEALANLPSFLTKIGDTMSMLGLVSTRERMVEAAGTFESALDAIEFDPESLVGVADCLLMAESVLNIYKDTRSIHKAENYEHTQLENSQQQLIGSVVSESQKDMSKAREAILEYLQDVENKAKLSTLPEMIDKVAGAMFVAQLEPARSVLTGLGEYIRNGLLKAKQVPTPTEQDTIADLITGIEYFLDAVAENKGNQQAYLQVAESALASLSANISVVPEPEPEPEPAPAYNAPETTSSAPAAATDTTSPEIEAPEVALQIEPAAQDTAPEQEEPADADSPVVDTLAAPVIKETAAFVEPFSRDLNIIADDVDEEILEIFIEECLEEHQRISELFPIWKQNTADNEAISTIRRSFHTLKGSGRLVGAQVIGEFGWAMENMMNRVMDASIPCSKDVINLVEDTIGLLPQMVEQLTGNREPLEGVYEHMARAWCLAEGRNLEETAASNIGSAPEAPEEPAEPAAAPEPEPIEVEVLEEPAADEPPAAVSTEAESVALLDDAIPDLNDVALDDLNIAAEPEAPEALEIPELSGEAENLPVLEVEPAISENLPDNQAELAATLAVPILEEQTADDIHLEPLAEPAASSEPSPQNSAPVYYDSVEMDANAIALPADMDPVLAEIYGDESRAHIDTIEGQLAELAEQPLYNNEPLTRALHTLHGSSRVAGVDPVADIARRLEYYGNDCAELGEPWQKEAVALLAQSCVQFRQALQFLADPNSTSAPDLVALLHQIDPLAERASARVAEKPESTPEPIPSEEAETTKITPPALAASGAETDSSINIDNSDELVQMFLEEGIELIDECDASLQRAEEEGYSNELIEALQRQMHTLKGGARMAEMSAMGDLAHALEELVIEIKSERIRATDAVKTGLRAGCDQLAVMINEVQNEGKLTSANAVLANLAALRDPDYQPPESTPAATVAPAAEVDVAEPAPLALEPEEVPAAPIAVTPVAPAGEPIGSPVPSATGDEQIVAVNREDELVDIFLDEAEGIVHNCDNLFDGIEKMWLANNTGADFTAACDALKRELHTLKGGAYMAQVASTGDLAHALENCINAIAGDKIKKSDAAINVVKNAVDKLAEMLIEIKTTGQLTSATALVAILNQISQNQAISTPAPSAPASASTPATAPSAPPAPADTGVAPKAMTTGVSEQVRVSAERLENLVNNAGEVSIFQSRTSQKLTNFSSNLGELEQTIARMHEQVRQIAIETDAQIDSRIERETQAPQDANFDPLEMDRYSNMQQLTRSLSETVNDLEELKNTFENLVRDAETIMVQQQRVSTDLQEGLMATRMVSFEGLTSRLRRLVRQTSTTLGKKANISFVGMEHEVDRSIQEHMVSPLEHMIRNALAHGIEAPAVRAQKGKDASGEIVLSVDRDGSYIVITLKDDGAGIDIEALRQKAQARNLIDPANMPDDRALMQLILHSGFSTAKEVSQVAGRGVGMDVVNNEIKALGGTLHINSVQNQGTTFSIRLPLTLAINQALMVTAGEDVYAVQLNAIESVARVMGSALQKQYLRDTPMFQYNDELYNIYHLSQLLGQATQLDLQAHGQYSLLLVRIGERRLAVHIDSIVGRREIVVKPIGRQLSSVAGIAGATILDDGEVAFILEFAGLINRLDRQQDVIEVPTVIDSEQSDNTMVLEGKTKAGGREMTIAKTVMVVDDSITIRKVTTRFLERNHYKVVTAKDGMDAVAQLQEVTPDIMLLDIEMPRMDGFGVAEHVRNSVSLRDLPIIMITSRTGDKHRERAMGIGVNRYLGKPFQEDQLLAEISSLLESES